MQISVVDTDPVGSAFFGQIRILIVIFLFSLKKHEILGKPNLTEEIKPTEIVHQ